MCDFEVIGVPSRLRFTGKVSVLEMEEEGKIFFLFVGRGNGRAQENTYRWVSV